MNKINWLFALFLVCWSTASSAWWSEDWSYRRKISLNTSAAGVETKANVDQAVILFRLHSGNFSFLDAKEDGSDIRLVGNDDKTPLKYHIEQYDSVNELGLVWVQLPKISAGSTAEYLWIYFGNQEVGGATTQRALTGLATPQSFISIKKRVCRRTQRLMVIIHRRRL